MLAGWPSPAATRLMLVENVLCQRAVMLSAGRCLLSQCKLGVIQCSQPMKPNELESLQSAWRGRAGQGAH